nr:nucleotide-binding alpha-beta plait domain-containing protein [Tanacetum cinerariifolium]
MVINNSFRSKEDDVMKISTTMFVTNFPDESTAKELFCACSVYGHVVDSYIPNKRAKNGAQATNIIAGNLDDDSDSEYNEQVIVVPLFPSNSFAGPSSSNGPSVTERNADYAEELARLQRQEYEAKDAVERYGYLFLQETSDILRQAEADIRKNGVSATLDSAVPSDVCKDQLSFGIFTSSSYDDDFSATLTNLAPTVAVNPIP